MIFQQWIVGGKGYSESAQRYLGVEQDGFAEIRNDASTAA